MDLRVAAGACRAPARSTISPLDAPALAPRATATIGEVIDLPGTLYERLLRPLLLAALNTEPPEGSAGARGAVIRETLAAGGQRLPAADRARRTRRRLDRAGARASAAAQRRTVRFGHQLRAMRVRAATRVEALDFGERDGRARRRRRRDPRRAAVDGRRRWSPASRRRPNSAPSSTRISASQPPPDQPPIIGRGQRHDRVAVRLSRPAVGHHQRRRPPARHAARALARTIWSEVAAVDRACPDAAALADRAGTAGDLRRNARAGCAKRPGPNTRWDNLFLAGDWTDTGLAGHHRRCDSIRAAAPPISSRTPSRSRRATTRADD